MSRGHGITFVEVLIGITIAAVFAVVVAGWYLDWEGDTEVDAPTVAASSGIKGDLAKSMRIVCLEGHAYYFASDTSGFAETKHSRAVLAPKFDRDGKPAKCRAEMVE